MQLFADGAREEVIVKIYSILFLVILTFGGALSAAGQFPQMKKVEERRQAMIAADEQRQKAEKEGKPSPIAPRPVMNVDVRMLLTKTEYKNFADAVAGTVKRFVDGDPVWLYVKFNGKLERYVHKVQLADGTERYLLYVEYGPQGDITAKGHETLEFGKDELALTELKLSLAPGKAGHNKSLAIYFKNVADGKPGLWNNEIRLADLSSFPRSPGDYLATTGFTSDFSKGLVKYPAGKTAFRSMVLRDTTDEGKLPVPGKFDNTAARADLVTRLAAEGIAPSKVYFSDDFWREYSDIPTSIRQYRAVTGTFLYRKGTVCLYGTADIKQAYDAMNDRFNESTIELQKDISIPCTEFK